MVLWLFMFFHWPIKPDSSAVIMYIWISILEVKNVSCYISLGISNGNISSCITNVLTAQPGTVQVGSGSSWDPNLNKNINNAQLAHPDPGLKGKSKFQPSILTEGQVTFSDPHNRSGVSQRERISPNANTTEANCDHALKRGKKKKRGGNRWKTQHVFAPPVCRDQSCPEVSQHSDQIQSFIYPGWERGGRKQGRTRADISENMRTS